MATADNMPSLAARTIVVAQLATARDVQRPACRTLGTAAMPTLATAATVLIFKLATTHVCWSNTAAR